MHKRPKSTKKLVAIDNDPFFINYYNSIGIAIQCDAEIGPMSQHGITQGSRCGSTEAVVDIEPIGLGADGHDLGPELVENLGRRVVSRAVRTVDDNLQAAQVREFAYHLRLAGKRHGRDPHLGAVPQGQNMQQVGVQRHHRLQCGHALVAAAGHHLQRVELRNAQGEVGTLEYAETGAKYEFMNLSIGGLGEGLRQEELVAVKDAFEVQTELI